MRDLTLDLAPALGGSDSTFADVHHTLHFVMVSENGGDWVGKTERGQGTKLMVLAQGQGTPLGACVEQAAPPAVRLRERPLDSGKVQRRRGACRRSHQRGRLSAERGDEGNGVRALLVPREIEPISPKRRHNPVATHPDGRKHRHSKRRWLTERTHAWLRHWQRLVARSECTVTHVDAPVQLAWVLRTLKKV